MNKPKITVVGSFAVGMTIRTEHMPVWGETLIGSDFDMGPGGKGSNQAIGTSRMGADSSFVGIIGQDKLGEIATDLYASEGIDTSLLEQHPDVPTGAGLIILNEEGENFIILDMGANNLMDAAFVDMADQQIAASDIVMSVLEIPVEAALRAMELGKKHGVRTLLNPAPASPLDKNAFQYIDLLTPNETELRILLGRAADDPTPTLELAQELKSLGVQTVIVTMGGSGSLIVTDAGTNEIKAPIVNVVDTTGAGDSFNSGLAVALAEGKDLVTAVQMGNVAGALACTALGVIPSLPDRQTLDSLYSQTY